MLVPTDLSAENYSLSFPRKVVILGSTGSIGRSALDVIRLHPDNYKVLALVGGKNWKELLAQALEFKPRYVALMDKGAYKELRANLPQNVNFTSELLCGEKAICELASHPDADVVLAAIVGIAGLRSVLAALEAGKHVALANKESLVCGGPFVKKTLTAKKAALLPVDSEHSAIFQVLQGEKYRDIEKLILTASGGPFLKTPVEELSAITPADAVKHPRWSMGAKISVDSATLMNKALEVIEAFWLFDVGVDTIDVVVHPQSIVHSLVAFVDGTQIAQLSTPDMKGPIAYALGFPCGRLPHVMRQLNLAAVGTLEFAALDSKKFPAVNLAKDCLREGGASAAVLSIANEFAVEAFLQQQLSFDGIMRTVQEALNHFADRKLQNLDELNELENEIGMKYRFRTNN